MRVSPTTLIALAAGGFGIAVAYGMYTYGDDVKQAAADALDAVNPTNPENVFAKAANKVVQGLTGDSSNTLGSWIYDLLHPGENDIAKPVAIVPAAGSIPGAPAAVSAPPPAAPATSPQGPENGAGPAPLIGVQGSDPTISIVFGGGA